MQHVQNNTDTNWNHWIMATTVNILSFFTHYWGGEVEKRMAVLNSEHISLGTQWPVKVKAPSIELLTPFNKWKMQQSFRGVWEWGAYHNSVPVKAGIKTTHKMVNEELDLLKCSFRKEVLSWNPKKIHWYSPGLWCTDIFRDYRIKARYIKDVQPQSSQLNYIACNNP